jgi:phosphatidylinositol alpha-1,6-mannosyltransferase
MRQSIRPEAGRLLVLSENFPPIIGGSARWAGKIAEYWPGPVDVLMARRDGLGGLSRHGRITSHRRRFVFPSWAPDRIASVGGYFSYTGQALWLAARGRPRWVLVGRGLPEGMAALAVKTFIRRPYAVLAHGEEIATCDSSGLLRRQLRMVYSQAKLVIANSQNTARLALACGARDDNCIVCHPGMDAARFGQIVSRAEARARLGLKDEKVLLSVGRLEWRKNQQAVVRAMSRVLAGGLRVKYLVAGDGDQRTALEQLARQLSVESHVRMLGAVPEEMLTALYRASDLFVLPGLATPTQFEGFGIVFLEAAAAGIPSICGRAGGSAEAVLDGQTGLVIDGSDEAGLIAALDRLLRDDDLRERMGRQARQRAIEQFDWPVLMRQLLGRMQVAPVEEVTA